MFVDQVRIFVKAGSGGNGACSFRREKYVPRGGPDGGDGGNGGSVILQPSHRLTTLLDLRYQQEYRADPGRPGEGSNRHGKTAPDVVISVPVGTLIMDDESGEVLAELTAENQTYVAARGDAGGEATRSSPPRPIKPRLTASRDNRARNVGCDLS